MPGVARLANGHPPERVLGKNPGISPVAGELLPADRVVELGRWIGSDLCVDADCATAKTQQVLLRPTPTVGADPLAEWSSPPETQENMNDPNVKTARLYLACGSSTVSHVSRFHSWCVGAAAADRIQLEQVLSKTRSNSLVDLCALLAKKLPRA